MDERTLEAGACSPRSRPEARVETWDMTNTLYCCTWQGLKSGKRCAVWARMRRCRNRSANAGMALALDKKAAQLACAAYGLTS